MLTFDAATHTYRIDGAIVPSVTQVLRPLQDFSGIPPHVLERKRVYGTAVHEMIEREIKGELGYGDEPPELTGALHAFWKWMEEHPALAAELPKAVVEKVMVQKRLGFAGKPDIILDGLMVIDLKTRLPKPMVDSIQLAAYEELHKHNGGGKGRYDHRILSLLDDGTYKFQRVNHKDAFNRFRHLLDIHNMTAEITKWRM